MLLVLLEYIYTDENVVMKQANKPLYFFIFCKKHQGNDFYFKIENKNLSSFLLNEKRNFNWQLKFTKIKNHKNINMFVLPKGYFFPTWKWFYFYFLFFTSWNLQENVLVGVLFLMAVVLMGLKSFWLSIKSSVVQITFIATCWMCRTLGDVKVTKPLIHLEMSL